MRTRTISFVLITLAVSTLPAFAQRKLPDARERARAPYSMGLEQWKIEAWDDAEKSFKAAIDIDPAFEMAYYMLGRTHMNQKRYADAATAYEKARNLYQQENGRQYTDAQERQRQRDNRIRDIDDVIRTYQGAPQNQQTINAIRQLENQKRLTQEAMSRSNTTMTLGVPVPAYVSMSLGSAYFRMGNLAGAEKEYKAAIVSDPKAGEAHSNLAVVYLETGRLVDADKSVQAAEKAGFKVNPQLKEEIQNRKKTGT